MENLGRFVLDRLHFNLMRRILSLAVPQRLLQPLERIGSNRVPPGSQEQHQFLKKKKQREKVNHRLIAITGALEYHNSRWTDMRNDVNIAYTFKRF